MNSIEQNKEIATRFLALVGAHDVDSLVSLVAPTWTMEGGPPGLAAGEEGLRRLFATFGDIQQTWEIQDVIAEGDRVVVRAVNTCVQDQFFGVPAHGKQQRFTAMFMHRIVDGKVVQTWRNADDLGRLLQLGARICEPPADDG